ncbi:hypothetical protein BH24PSE2_BH24PSE2_17750 [soil metagenome]
MTRFPILVHLVVSSFAVGAGPAAADPNAGEVRDLHYGEALFHFFQQDWPTSLTHLLAAREQDRVAHHAGEAELLLGGLWLSYGQHEEAGAIFERLLSGRVEEHVRNRAWFYLAKIRYQRGLLEEARQALAAITGPVPEPLEPERQFLHAQVLLASGRYDDAIAVLNRWQSPEEWSGYARFNLGVALVRTGRHAEGAELLDEVGRLRGRETELDSLRDKANVALGYARLQAGEPALARSALQRVRLEGAFSNKALLGAGWADSAEERYRQALVPWRALQHRDLLDPAVQESMLAVPYALAQLDAGAQAMDRYRQAIGVFEAERTRLDQSIAGIRAGRLVEPLLAREQQGGTGWFWQLAELPDAPESHYLYHLMAQHEFQEGLKDYRDLREMQASLARWSDDIGTFRAMLDAQEQAYAERLPRVAASLDAVDLDALVAQQEAAANRLADIERRRDVVALGTASERRQWTALETLGRELDRRGSEPDIAEARGKHRLLRGVLLWKLDREYKARLWRARRSLGELEQAVAEAQARHAVVGEARREALVRFEGFEQRIADVAPRIAALQLRVARALGGQQRHLQALAVDELEEQRERLDAYTVQARFALATLYDRASTSAAAAP